MQLVFEFGAKELEPVVETIQAVLGSTPYSLSCLPNDSDTYGPSKDSLVSAVLKLKRRELASVAIDPKSGLVRYGLVTGPFFDGQNRSIFLGTIEYLGNDYNPLWTLILGVRGLSVACLGFEEGVELDDSRLTAETFPWHQWPLVIGAIRNQSGSEQWTIKQGPEIRWFSPSS